MSGRNSSHEAKVGRHGKSCYTKSRASMARTGSVVATGVLRGVISSGEDATIARGKISFRNGGMCGSPYISQR